MPKKPPFAKGGLGARAEVAKQIILGLCPKIKSPRTNGGIFIRLLFVNSGCGYQTLFFKAVLIGVIRRRGIPGRRTEPAHISVAVVESTEGVDTAEIYRKLYGVLALAELSEICRVRRQRNILNFLAVNRHNNCGSCEKSERN